MWLKHVAAIRFQACISIGAALRREQPRRPLLAPGALFTTTASHQKIQRLPPRPKPPPDEEIIEVYLKGSGPGGQKINKTSSAVQLKHIPTGLVIKCQETRSRSQNRKLARQHLAEKIDDVLNGTASRSAIVARLKAKKKASAIKKSHRKHVRAQIFSAGAEKQEEKENYDEDEDAEDDASLDLPTEQSGSKTKPFS